MWTLNTCKIVAKRVKACSFVLFAGDVGWRRRILDRVRDVILILTKREKYLFKSRDQYILFIGHYFGFFIQTKLV